MRNFPDLAETAIRAGKALLYLKAEGGIGKSTSLYELWRRLLNQPQGNDGKTIIPLYIPLGAVDGGILDYITVSILKWIGNREEYVKNLKVLLSNEEQQYRYVLLLDGANENEKMHALQGEILELSGFGAVSIVLSSRTDIQAAEMWKRWTIDMLPPETIRKYVLPEHRNEENLKILGIPFYLEKYLKIKENDPDRLKKKKLNRFSLIQEYSYFTMNQMTASKTRGQTDHKKAVSQSIPKLGFQMAARRRMRFSVEDDMMRTAMTEMEPQTFCEKVLQPMGIAEPSTSGYVYQLSHELYRDAFASWHLLNFFDEETSGSFLKLLAGNLPEDVLVLFADALRESKDGLRVSLDKINGWIGRSEIAKENGRLMKNLVRLYAETGPKLERVDFSGRNLRQASFSTFSHLLNCAFDGAEFSSETMAFPVRDDSNEQKVLFFPKCGECGRIVRFCHQRLQILSAENGDILAEWHVKGVPALIEAADNRYVVAIYHPLSDLIVTCKFVRWDVSTCIQEQEGLLESLNDQFSVDNWLWNVTDEEDLVPQWLRDDIEAWYDERKKTISDAERSNTQVSDVLRQRKSIDERAVIPKWMLGRVQLWHDNQKILISDLHQPDTVYAVDLATKTFQKLEGQVIRLHRDVSVKDCLFYIGKADTFRILQGTYTALYILPKSQWMSLKMADFHLQKLWTAVIKMEAGRHPRGLSFVDNDNRRMTVHDAVWLPGADEHLLLCGDAKNMPVLERFKVESGEMACDSGIAISQLYTTASPVDFPKLCSDGERILVYTSRKIAEIFLKGQRTQLLYESTSAEDMILDVYITGNAVLVQSRESGLLCIKQRSVWWNRETAVQLSFLEWYGIPGVATSKRIFWATLQNGTFHLQKAARKKVSEHKSEQGDAIWGEITSISQVRASAEKKEYLVLVENNMEFNIYHVIKGGEQVHPQKIYKTPKGIYYYGRFCGPYCVLLGWDDIEILDAEANVLFHRDFCVNTKGQWPRCHWTGHDIWICGVYPDDEIEDAAGFYRICLDQGTIEDMGQVSAKGWNLKTIHWDAAQGAFLVESDAEHGGGVLALYPPQRAGGQWRTETLEASEYVWNRANSGERFLSFEEDKAHLYNEAGEEIRQILPFGHEVTGSTFQGAEGLSEEQLEILKDYGGKIPC